jgi:hypothetical protein
LSPEDLLLVGSIACSCAFYLAAGAAYVLRRPLSPPDLPATSDVGKESPAVANLLANSGKVTPDAVPATLLDLAARRVIEIEESEPHVYAVRVGGASTQGLTAYESRVLSLLHSKAARGVVPAAALTTGVDNQARSWFRSFAGDVIREARDAGLCAPRWPPQLLTVLGLFTGGALLLMVFAGEGDDERTFFWFATAALAFVTLGASARLFQETAQLVSQAGLPEQGRWLALRKFLHGDELFASLPPTAVVVRERYLAYGAALGVAAAAVRAIPMGAENDRRAWSSYGGKWRQVTVSYPTMWPPAWGASPGDSIWRGIRLAMPAVAILFVFSLLMSSLSFAQSSPQELRLGSAIAVLIAAGALVVLGTAMWLALAGIITFFGGKQVTGVAIRLRSRGDPPTSYIAIDDGTRDHIRAWKVGYAIYNKVTEYSTVTVTVTPFLGFVRGVQPAETSAVTTEPEPART